MAKQDPLHTLKQDPAAAALLGDREKLAALLRSDEARTLAGLLQSMGGPGLQQAAQAAAGGDPTALNAILGKVRSDPRGAGAMDAMEKKTSR